MSTRVFVLLAVACGCAGRSVAEPAVAEMAPLASIRPFPTLAPAPEAGWRADASAVLRGDLDQRHARVDAPALVDRLSAAAASGEALALSALGHLQLYGIVDSTRELELRPFHPLFHALRGFERPPTLRPNASAALSLLGAAAAAGEPSAQSTLGVLMASHAFADVFGDELAARLPRDDGASRALLARAAAAGEPIASAAAGLRLHDAGECEGAAAAFERGAAAAVARARAAGSTQLDNSMPNLGRASGARMRAGEIAELRAWADKAGRPPNRETSEAALTYAQLCVEGAHGLPRNLTTARRYYEAAAGAGEGGAHVALGLLELMRGEAADGRAAVAALARGIERAWNPVDKAQGWSALAQLALDGRELGASDGVALRCYREAAATGYLEGFFNLGALHYAGRGTKRDVGVAAALFAEAASSGHLPSMHALGALAARGEGVARDCGRAAALLQPVVFKHEFVERQGAAAVRAARRWDYANALLRSEPLAIAGVPGALRRTGEAYEGLAALAHARGESGVREVLLGRALLRYEAAAAQGSVAATLASARLWRRGAARSAAGDALRARAARAYAQLEASGYEEARWQLLTMRARGELGARGLRALEGEIGRQLLRPTQPWAQAATPTLRYAALWAVAAFARWGKWVLLWATLSCANSIFATHLRPSLAREAVLRAGKAELAAGGEESAGGAVSRAATPRVFAAIEGALREAGWRVRETAGASRGAGVL